MRFSLLAWVGSMILVLSLGMAALGQLPPGGKGAKEKSPKPPPDDESEIIKQIREAYKAPFEVHEDVLKELRKAYQQPTPEREAKIFKELRRLYLLTPEREMAILREVRRAYERPSAAQEERVFQEIARAEPLPVGTVPASVQAEQTKKLFGKLDLNGDGLLSHDEMPDVLRGERARWDANRDGFVDLEEYWAYYQGRLESLSEQVASGQLELKPINGKGPDLNTVPPARDEPRPAVYRGGQLPAGLPDWFGRFDTDRDGQVALYEWLRGGRTLKEFVGLDPNNDGFITAEEQLRYLAQRPQDRPEMSARGGKPKSGPAGSQKGIGKKKP